MRAQSPRVLFQQETSSGTLWNCVRAVEDRIQLDTGHGLGALPHPANEQRHARAHM